MSRRPAKETTTAQPPAEQPVQIEIFRNLTTGGRVSLHVEVPGEAFFQTAMPGDTMPCKVLAVEVTSRRERPDE